MVALLRVGLVSRFRTREGGRVYSGQCLLCYFFAFIPSVLLSVSIIIPVLGIMRSSFLGRTCCPSIFSTSFLCVVLLCQDYLVTYVVLALL